MSTLSTTELEAQVDTDLDDTTLQLIIDAVERDIDEFVGPASAYTFEAETEEQVELALPVGLSALTSVVEYTDARHDPTKTTLAADDYELSDDGWGLRRLSDGTNSRSTWGYRAVVTGTPVADVARRKQATVALCRFLITETAHQSERIGDWSATSKDYRKERARILGALDDAVFND
jgi:hypothetical protein